MKVWLHWLYMGNFRSFVYSSSTVQCFVWLNSNNVSSASGYIAAVTEVHCLCDVRCYLAMDQERLHGSFSWMDVRTLIKFHVLLGKSALECYKSLKEGLRTRAPSYETVWQWMNAVKNSWEGTDNASRSGVPTSATDECHVEQVKSVLERMHSISCTAIATEVGISPASVYPFLINSLGKEKFVDMCSTLIKEPCMFILSPHICSIGEMKAMHSSIAFWRSWMHPFDPHLKRQDAEWRSQTSPRKKIAWRSQGALKWTCPWPSLAIWHNSQWPILLHTVAG